MPETAKVKLIHGLSDFHLAAQLKDDRTGVEYDEVFPLEGAISVGVNPNTSSTPKYADNGVFDVINALGDIDVTMGMVDLPQTVQNLIYNQKTTNGVTFSNNADEPINLALGFKAQIKGGGHRFYWLLKGKPELRELSHETDEDTIESKDTELNLKFMPLRYNHNWKSQLDTKEITTKQWFKDVVYDDEMAEALTEPETP